MPDDSPGEDVAFYLAALEGLRAIPSNAGAAVQLTSSLRSLLAASVGSTASDAVLLNVASEVDSLVERLRPFVGWSAAQWALNVGGPAGRYLCHPLLGPANPLAPPIDVEFDGERVRGIATYDRLHEGRFGVVHNSSLTAAVVALVSLVTVSNGRRGSLRSLEAQYPHAAPLHTEITYEAFIDVANHETTRVRVTGLHGETAVIDATANLDPPNR